MPQINSYCCFLTQVDNLSSGNPFSPICSAFAHENFSGMDTTTYHRKLFIRRGKLLRMGMINWFGTLLNFQATPSHFASNFQSGYSAARLQNRWNYCVRSVKVKLDTLDKKNSTQNFSNQTSKHKRCDEIQHRGNLRVAVVTFIQLLRMAKPKSSGRYLGASHQNNSGSRKFISLVPITSRIQRQFRKTSKPKPASRTPTELLYSFFWKTAMGYRSCSQTPQGA